MAPKFGTSVEFYHRTVQDFMHATMGAFTAELVAPNVGNFAKISVFSRFLLVLSTSPKFTG